MFADNEETAEIPALLLLTAGMKKYLPDAKISECRLPLDMPLKFKLVRKALNKLLAKSTQV